MKENELNSKTEFVTSDKQVTDEEYFRWVNDIKLRLRSAQAKAAVRVNSTLIEFYWWLGQDIVAKKKEHKWGDSVVKQLSLDLRAAFPNQKGLSYTNLKYAAQVYLFYSKGFEFGQQAVGQIQIPEVFSTIPWGHHIQIMSQCENVQEALFYINKTIEGNWSRNRLTSALKSRLYAREGSAVTNFKDILPTAQGQMAQEILKDPYNFNFLTMQEEYQEKELEDALVHDITRFLLELGNGFAFVGRQMELRMPDGKAYFPDLVFYHIRMKCYIVVELKVVDFVPEFAGKLNFYVTASDKILRGKGDNPSIGLLICRSKDKTTVEWSLEGIDKPLGVATYELEHIVGRVLEDSGAEYGHVKRYNGKYFKYT